MPRPIWSGSISFGLVNVPVKLFSATSPKEVRFHMLHDKDGGRIQQSLSAVRRMGKALVISAMLYADEVVAQDEWEGLPDAHAKPGERELKMAEQLVGSLAGDFDVSKYRDDYRQQVLALLEKKAE